VLELSAGAVFSTSHASYPRTVRGAFVSMSGSAFTDLSVHGAFTKVAHDGRWKGGKCVAFLVGAASNIAIQGAVCFVQSRAGKFRVIYRYTHIATTPGEEGKEEAASNSAKGLTRYRESVTTRARLDASLRACSRA
jgi:hypothetical protein